MAGPENNAPKARARLALRAERALGLTSVRYKKAKTGEASSPRSRPLAAQTSSAQALSAQTTSRVAPVVPARAQPTVSRPAAPAGVASNRAPRIQSTETAAAPPPPQLLVAAEPSFEGPVFPREEKLRILQSLDEDQVKGCTRCVLCETRTQTVFADGDVDARLMFIGEGPGENEDLEGRPFVGRAGQLLDKMIAAMGLSREKVYIANIVKCRPPNNRQPAPDETAACTPYLLEQIRVIRPQVIVTLGLPSSQYILRTKLSMSKLRGQWQNWRGIKVMPTYHPAYVLRSYTKEVRETVWGDLQLVLGELGLPLPKSRS